MARVFLLSPANLGGERAQLLRNPRARFELARRLRSEGASLGEVMSFVSGLYFRGKLAYARAFADPPDSRPGVLVITPGTGLVDAAATITLAELESFAGIGISARDPRYLAPLLEDARILRRALGRDGSAILLGSIATGKYARPLLEVFGGQLLFPPAFVGRGDMSRGALLLRSVEAGLELDYEPLADAARHGPRPPRLNPRS